MCVQLHNKQQWCVHAELKEVLDKLPKKGHPYTNLFVIFPYYPLGKGESFRKHQLQSKRQNTDTERTSGKARRNERTIRIIMQSLRANSVFSVQDGPFLSLLVSTVHIVKFQGKIYHNNSNRLSPLRKTSCNFRTKIEQTSKHPFCLYSRTDSDWMVVSVVVFCGATSV